MNRYNIMLLLIVFHLILLPADAEVQTVTYCDALPIRGANWADNHTILLFDPSLGDLVQVDLAIDLNVLQDYRIENEGGSEQTVLADSEVELLITMPDLSPISVTASSSFSENLAGFDGELDYSGPSGRKIEGFASAGSWAQQYLKLSDFVASTPGETVSLPAATSVKSATQIPGNCVFGMSTLAGSKVCVTYAYEPEALGGGGASQ